MVLFAVVAAVVCCRFISGPGLRKHLRYLPPQSTLFSFRIGTFGRFQVSEAIFISFHLFLCFFFPNCWIFFVCSAIGQTYDKSYTYMKDRRWQCSRPATSRGTAVLAGVIALNYFLTQQRSQGVNIFMHIYNSIYQLNTESCIHCSSSHQVCIKIYPNPDSRAFSFQLPLHVFHFYMLCHIFNIATNTWTTSGSPGLLRRQKYPNFRIL